ncbi:MAG: hypothetical protein OXC55_06675 [Chloroflexi bacterium]|nr:hypothetical protein [Chloroflexota bacterium]
MLAEGKSFITLQGMSAEALLLAVKELAERPLPDGVAPTVRDGRAVATAFYEASTRTRLGFQFAARALGLDVIPLDVSASSVNKGESLTDTIRVLADYGIAALILRHPDTESMTVAMAASACPVINAGNGAGEHPVQTLIDLSMIYQRFGRLSGLKVTMTGDALHGRTIHSLIMALSLFGNSITVVSDPGLRLSSDLGSSAVRMSAPKLIETEFLNSGILKETDVLYMTRVQAERGSANRPIIMTEKTQQDLNPNAIVLHPMPRTVELPEWFDTDPRAAYLHRNRIGLGVMTYVLGTVIGGGRKA